MRLLCVTAHPDDEAGNFGGALALYASRGVETHVLCLTAGEAARNRGSARSSEELKALRRQEFQASCTRLGVKNGVVLDYPDGKLAAANLLEVVGDVVRHLRNIKPDIVVTFGPEGGVTAHFDHAMAGVFGSLAFQWAARDDRYPEQFAEGLQPHVARKLYFSTGLITLEGRQPVAQPPVTVSLDISPVLALKIAAFADHFTQAPLLPIFVGAVSRHGGLEHYHLAAAAEPRIAHLENDLFAGLEEPPSDK